MTGPEHYREAERLLAGWRGVRDPAVDLNDPYLPPTEQQVAMAHVHATLALTAAIAEANPEIAAYQPHDEESVLPWLDILGGPQPEALRARITAIHYEVDGSPHSNGSCIEDGQDYPCATLRALNTEAGA